MLLLTLWILCVGYVGFKLRVFFLVLFLLFLYSQLLLVNMCIFNLWFIMFETFSKHTHEFLGGFIGIQVLVRRHPG